MGEYYFYYFYVTGGLSPTNYILKPKQRVMYRKKMEKQRQKETRKVKLG
jgi:hypothetical protein